MTKQLERRRAGEAETGVIVLGMFFCENLLLAPTGALVLMMVYYISGSGGNFFRF